MTMYRHSASPSDKRSISAVDSSIVPNRPDHSVHFYESEALLANTVADFLASGIAAGQRVVMIASKTHAPEITSRLVSKGIDVEGAEGSRQILLMDAETQLSQFMVDGLPDERLFEATVGALIQQQLEQAGGSGLRAYGEMVDLLWKRGERDAAIRLEEYWHRLAARHPFALLCAYSMGNFYDETGGPSVDDVCRTHTYIAPPEPQTDAADEREHRLRSALLERRAQSLEAEVEHRRMLEAALRSALAERARVENAMRETEQELRDFLENAVDGMHWVGPDGRILWANEAELQLLGYSREEYIGRHIAQFHADEAAIADMLSRLRRNEILRDYAARLRCKDGSVRDVLVSSSVFWRDGEFVHTRCVTRDVTDQKRVELERQRVVRHLAAEHAVTRILADRRPFDETVPRLLETIGSVGSWQAGTLWMVDEATDTLRCVDVWRSAAALEPFESLTRRSSFHRGVGLPGRVWNAGEPVWIDDVTRDSNFPRAALAGEVGLHSALGFPICVSRRITGVLEFFSGEARPADRDLLQMFDAVGTQIGQFIERRETDEVRDSLAAIVDSSDDAIVSKTLDGVITSWNRGAEQIFGYTAAEAVGQHITLIIPSDRLVEEADVLARLRRGEKIDHYETERQTKDGRRLNISLTVSPLRNADGVIVGASKVARDITERRRIHAALAESERRFRVLADSAPVLIWVNGTDGGCEFVNKAYLDFFGESLEQVQGLGWTSHVHPDDRDRCLTGYLNAHAMRAPYRCEVRLRRADGEYRWMESLGLPQVSAAGEFLGYVGVSPDITERKRAEESLRQSVLARDEFLSVASHELRNPLNALQLQLVGLHRAAEERGSLLEKDWVCARVSQATDDVGTLVRLVHNLLDVARITAGRLDLEPEAIDFDAVVRTVLRKFGQHVSSGQVALDMEPVTGRCDRLRFEQVVTNLISNAVKYGEGKRIDISLRADAHTVYFAVADQGIGIDPDRQQHLFQRFVRAVPRRQYGGFGLGLWIARETLTAMGGQISLVSEPGVGSTFSVSLPRIAVPQIDAEQEKNTSQQMQGTQ
jgi:PAS domain S-box-containing protein